MRLRNHARRRVVVGSPGSASRRRAHERSRDAHAEALAAVAPRSWLEASQEELRSDRTHLDEHDGDARVVAPVRLRRARKVSDDRASREGEGSDDQQHVETRLVQSRASTLSPTKQPRVLTRRLSGEGISEAMKQVSSSYHCLLQSAFAQEDRIDETNWLTGTLIDLMLWRLATQYPDVYFLATDFCHLHLPSIAKKAALSAPDADRDAAELYDIRDVLGRNVDYASSRPIVFVANIGHIHWNLLRIQFEPEPELQLFEPMGRLSSRSGLSYRSVPRCVIEWLDACYPLDKSWISRSVSAITRPQQVSGYDCGVACLLYADKCGQGQSRELINESTDQHEITTFRSELQRQLQSELQRQQ